MAARLRDVIIVLPGISGSRLQRDGRDIWALSGGTAWELLAHRGRWLEALTLEDPDEDDGVRATSLLGDLHLIPGLVKIDGYGKLTRFLRKAFDTVLGAADDPAPANFVEFPYDWRRDNRRTARRLGEVVERKLTAWQEHTGNPDARVILVAHSMGGLVSRYWLEVLEGWRRCRALITIGTPYRGAVNALDYLSNGYKNVLVDLTEVMRSLPSVYQLLPIYRALDAGGEWHRVAELEVPGIEGARAADALAFHREIEAAVEEHRSDPDYERMVTIPIVGTRQDTLQSAVLAQGKVTASAAMPAGIDADLAEGDGTVPRVSAVPIELSQEYRESYVPERHSSLQNHPGILEDLRGRLMQMQQPDLGAIRGPERAPALAGRPALSLTVEDLYLEDEPVMVRARIVNQAEEHDVVGRIEPVSGGETRERKFTPTEDGSYRLDLDDLPTGPYRIEVATRVQAPGAPTPVHDVFQIVR